MILWPVPLYYIYIDRDMGFVVLCVVLDSTVIYEKQLL